MHKIKQMFTDKYLKEEIRGTPLSHRAPVHPAEQPPSH